MKIMGNTSIAREFLENLKLPIGYDIWVSQAMVSGYRQARKHKKRRINKKWQKRYGDVPVWDMEHCYVIESSRSIVVSPGMYEELKKNNDYVWMKERC